MEREEQTKPKPSRRKEITKNRRKIHKIEDRKTTKKTKETERWFFERRDEMDKPSARMTKKERRTQITNIGHERGGITRDLQD